jgi:site-specific recombinase
MATPDLLEPPLFRARFAAGAPHSRPVARLHLLVTTVFELTSDGCAGWLEDLWGWVFERGAVPERQAEESEVAARTRVLVCVFEESPGARERLQQAVARVLSSGSATRLFTDTGLPTHAGFWRESFGRVALAALPRPPVGRDLARFVQRLVPSARVAQWVGELPPALRRRLGSVLGIDDGRLLLALEPAMREAAVLLAARLSSHGSGDDVRRRAPHLSVHDSPFLALPTTVRQCLDAALPLARALGELERCREVLHTIERSLDDTGISVDLVFRLELMRQLCARLCQLLTLLRGDEAHRDVAWQHLSEDLLEGVVRERSLSALWGASTQLLARRVVERAGHGGEHYLTSTRAEQHEMVGAAAGGGALTGVMVCTKLLLSGLHLPVMWEAGALGLNYGLGFVGMQLAHFTLATKQPAMTAATLAGSIEEGTADVEPDLGPLLEQVARASRTQLAALVGNLGAVVPASLLLALLAQPVLGHPMLAPEKAEHVLAQHHPWASGTVIYAALTGVWLWASSLIAGAVENWFVLQELPGAIATHRTLRRLLGPARQARLARFMTQNISGFGGNLGFGLLLGFIPAFCALWGVPLEVRHVTFVAGQLAWAACALGPGVVTRPAFLLALLSVPLVGALNFGVSFVLALAVAVRARGLSVADQVKLLPALARRFARDPASFLVAPRG